MHIEGILPATSDNKPDYCDIEVSSKSFWARPALEMDEVFAQLRAEQPVSWQRPIEGAVVPDPDDPGFWAVVRHADIKRVSHDNQTFVSGQGVFFDRLPPLFLEMALSFLAMDPPRHDQLRRLVSKAFTPPRQIRRIEDKIELAAKQIIDDIATDPSGEIEFMDRCASLLPVRMFCEMFGVPEHLEEATVKHVIGSVSWADEEYLAGRSAAEVQLESIAGLHQVAKEIIDLRRREPGDDIISSMTQAEIDGQKLTDFEIASFFCLLSGAATDTTKTTLGHAYGTVALPPRSAHVAARRLRRTHQHRHRGVHPLGDTATHLQPHRRRRNRTRWPDDHAGRQSGDDLSGGQFRRRRLRPPPPGIRSVPLPPQSSCELRRRRHTLLPGCQPGPVDASGRNTGVVDAHTRIRDRRARPVGYQLHSWHQTSAVPVHAAMTTGMYLTQGLHRAVRATPPHDTMTICAGIVS